MQDPLLTLLIIRSEVSLIKLKLAACSMQSVIIYRCPCQRNLKRRRKDKQLTLSNTLHRCRWINGSKYTLKVKFSRQEQDTSAYLPMVTYICLRGLTMMSASMTYINIAFVRTSGRRLNRKVTSHTSAQGLVESLLWMAFTSLVAISANEVTTSTTCSTLIWTRRLGKESKR